MHAPEIPKKEDQEPNREVEIEYPVIPVISVIPVTDDNDDNFSGLNEQEFLKRVREAIGEVLSPQENTAEFQATQPIV